jgi:hypothetical protein
MKLRRRHRRAFGTIARMCMLAVLVQALLPAFHRPAQASASFPFADLAICSSSDALDFSVPLKNGTDKTAAHCPICWALQQLDGGFTVPVPLSTPPPKHNGELASPFSEIAAETAVSFRSSAQPRGPPILA